MSYVVRAQLRLLSLLRPFEPGARASLTIFLVS
jgi:hypothetical protein